MSKRYYAAALRVARVSKLLDRQKIAGRLTKKLGREVTQTDVRRWEEGKEAIDSELFTTWCRVLRRKKNKIKKVAQLMQEESAREVKGIRPAASA